MSTLSGLWVAFGGPLDPFAVIKMDLLAICEIASLPTSFSYEFSFWRKSSAIEVRVSGGIANEPSLNETSRRLHADVDVFIDRKMKLDVDGIGIVRRWLSRQDTDLIPGLIGQCFHGE